MSQKLNLFGDQLSPCAKGNTFGILSNIQVGNRYRRIFNDLAGSRSEIKIRTAAELNGASKRALERLVMLDV